MRESFWNECFKIHGKAQMIFKIYTGRLQNPTFLFGDGVFRLSACLKFFRLIPIVI